MFEPVPPGDGGDGGGTEFVVEFVDGVYIGGRGTDTVVGDVRAADHGDAADQSRRSSSAPTSTR